MKRGRGKEDLNEFELNVECKKCGKKFDFADYLTSKDKEKHIAELVIEKCGGDDILCDGCREKSKKVLDRGKFEVVKYGNIGIADMEFETEKGDKSVWKFKSAEDNNITFEVLKKVDLEENEWGI